MIAKQNITSFIATITNESNIDAVFGSIYRTIISSIQKFLRTSSDWINDSVADHNINISKYDPFGDNSYINVQKELHQPEKSLINIQSVNSNECYKWCLVRYLHLTDHNSTRIGKVNNFLKMNKILRISTFLSKLGKFSEN